MVGNADATCPSTSLNRILGATPDSAGAQNLDFTGVLWELDAVQPGPRQESPRGRETAERADRVPEAVLFMTASTSGRLRTTSRRHWRPRVPLKGLVAQDAVDMSGELRDAVGHSVGPGGHLRFRAERRPDRGFGRRRSTSSAW